MEKTDLKLLEWQLTPWGMDGNGGWKQQPIILIEGEIPFFANHPNDYIKRLQEMHDNPMLYRGSFYTLIGQFKDALELVWQKGEGE
jgi:hypothetical protein|tara:strand:+ start:2682 stop:2939 length:258 start_codon:yes stop_codon:yes gene_type:complete